MAYSRFSGGSDGKESACPAGDPGSIPGLGRSPGEMIGYSLHPVFLPGKFHGQRILAGYSPGGHKESDTTEQTCRRSPLKQALRLRHTVVTAFQAQKHRKVQGLCVLSSELPRHHSHCILLANTNHKLNSKETSLLMEESAMSCYKGCGYREGLPSGRVFNLSLGGRQCLLHSIIVRIK